jgi:uncharacterized protein DUF3179
VVFWNASPSSNRVVCLDEPSIARDNTDTVKRLFYFGLALLVLFEIANVYFIMPMPYSQRVRSIDLAYWLYSWRWPIRVGCIAMVLAGLSNALQVSTWRKAFVPLAVGIAMVMAYMTNFAMSADHMFLPVNTLVMQPVEHNTVESARLVVGVEVRGDARAYPVQFIGYHHQVRDTVGGQPVMVSFCTVCRTGRVFAPIVHDHVETFRLVGMDHFNAMFEDKTTGSWWRQATGEAVAGPSKGQQLAELPSRQVTLAEWLALHPTSLIMQPDPARVGQYSKSFDYETGASKSSLTGTDTTPWHDKAWVVGVTLNGESKAYDWNRLRREHVVNDVVGGKPIVLALAGDGVSFFAFARPDSATRFVLRNDSLVAGPQAFDLLGAGFNRSLESVKASQEFWHSWRTFQPTTKTY